jgi:hypothetical protein
MKALTGLERYLESARWPSSGRRPHAGPPGAHPPVVTISRQTGAGAHVVAEELVAILGTRAPAGSPPWTIFDRNLVDAVLEHHDLPKRLARFMPEDRVSGIADTMEELFGLRPSSWVLVRKTADTILHLAEVGNVVLIGRGANVITAGLAHAFHVRLVGSVARRIEYVRERLQVGPKEAAEYVRTEDVARGRYVRKYYGVDIEDPLLYDAVVNTDRVSYPEAARLIADAVTVVRMPVEEPTPGPREAVRT